MGGVVLLPDLSEFQPRANLAGIKSQNGGAVILRVGYGARRIDKVYTNHRAAAHEADFHFLGLYHYVTAGDDISAQAHKFCEWVGALKTGEIPIIDLEEGPGNQFSRATKWLDIVDAGLGLNKFTLNRRSWLYSGDYFARNAGLQPIFESIRHTWVAAYGDQEPSLPHTLWQSTDGKIGSHKTSWSGAGYCDTNFTRYTLAQLASTAWMPPHVADVGVWNIHPVSLLPTRATIDWEHTGGITEWQVHCEGPGFDHTNNVFHPQAVYEGLRSGSRYYLSIISIVNGHGVGTVGKKTFDTPAK